jgi:ABC-type transport system involved in Fe-S cluster assembly fused permease/ATPase subunit
VVKVSALYVFFNRYRPSTNKLKALARAIYAQKDLVILDDALSGLDADTENRVFHNLLGRDGLLRKHRTTVVVASSSGTFIGHVGICLLS